jgi:PPOX class probable F420-dependent enzyme
LHHAGSSAQCNPRPGVLAGGAGSRRGCPESGPRDGGAGRPLAAFALADRRDGRGRPILYAPLDEKPKRSPDPLRLARAEDIAARPEVTVLIDRWSEDWRALGWVRMHGEAAVVMAVPGEREEHAAAVTALRAKYRQYADHDLDARPMIRIAVTRATSWGLE